MLLALACASLAPAFESGVQGKGRVAASSDASAAPSSSQARSRTLVVVTQPGAVVWIDEVRRGVTNAEGKLEVALAPGRHTLRVRAKGFAERTLPVAPAARGTLNVKLRPTNDEAELLFQRAEERREKSGGAQEAAELYRAALKLRPRFAAAHVGLARALEALDDYDGALEQIDEARRDRQRYAEASTVEGRVFRALADYDGALAAFRRAIREGGGFQPEAYTGMGLLHEDKGEYEEAVEAFRKAISQLSDTEPILYELLGRNFEKLERWKEAAAAYDRYLELAPEGSHAAAIRSIIEQLHRQAAEQEASRPN